MKKIVWLLCMTVLLLTTVPVVAEAEDRGSIQVTLEAGDLAVTNGAVTLYQVGFGTEEGYRIADAFGGGIIRQADAYSEKLAQWLAETVKGSGMTMLLDADGCTVFPELEEGLYMLIQTERMDGFYPINPILITIPEGNQWDVQIHRRPVPVVTEIPKTSQSPLPFFGVLGMILSSVGLLLCVRKERNQ